MVGLNFKEQVMSDDIPMSTSIINLQRYAVKIKASLKEIIDNDYKVDDDAFYFFECSVRYLNEMFLILEDARIKSVQFDLTKIKIDELFITIKNSIEQESKWITIKDRS